MKLARLFDKNGIELKDGDLIQNVTENGFLWGTQIKVRCFGNEWFIETLPSVKNETLLSDDLRIEYIKNDAFNEGNIVLKTFKKIEKGE